LKKSYLSKDCYRAMPAVSELFSDAANDQLFFANFSYPNAFSHATIANQHSTLL